MPPTTRKVSGHRAAAGSRQATLSFNHRVTKASVPKQSAKEAALLTKKVEPEETKAEVEDKTAKAEEVKEEKPAAKEEKEAQDEEEEEEEEEEDAEPKEATEAPPSIARPEVEIEADAVTDAQIRRYWRSIEAQSMARRVHQEDLDLGEKVLRHFDVSSQFGPCVGITRKKRWARAQRLGLAPPIEVLAVLLQEEAKGVQGVERSSFDAILNATMAT